ncbi:hypothetical protein AB0J68_30710, partial [Micromonospora sp. NPDC049580]
MAKQQISRQQQMTERDQREQDAERNQDFGDQAASARLNVRRDALLTAGEQLAEVPPIAEHDVPKNEHH